MSPSTDALAHHLLASCPGLWGMVSNLWRENQSSRAGKRPAVWIPGALGGEQAGTWDKAVEGGDGEEPGGDSQEQKLL